MIRHIVRSKACAYVLVPKWSKEPWWQWAWAKAKDHWEIPRNKGLIFEPRVPRKVLTQPNWKVYVLIIDERV